MNNKSGASYRKFPQVVVVEASAGSGKTFALAKRYLQLLINPGLESKNIPLRNILAITFTNKATVEMKERILELLKKIALDVFSSKEEEKDILDLLAVGKKAAREKARIIMDEIIRHYNFFQVQTIDSFINALLLGCALNIDRSASFKIKRDYTQHLSYCLDLVIEQAAADREVSEFMDEFLQHYLFVENKTGWFPKEDILGRMRSLFRLGNKYGKNFGIYSGKSKDVIKKKKHVYGLIKELSSQFPEGINANSKKYICFFIEKNDAVFDTSKLPSAFQNPAPPINKGKTCPEDFEKMWRHVHKTIREFVEFEATVIYNPYIKLFQRLLDFFQRVSKREDVLFLEELNRKARLLFDEKGIGVVEVYYRLAACFKHYLIDEFQDTSILQWNNLYMMVEEALSVGGTLFYVGDKKQAIYRFRGGEAELFDSLKTKFAHFNVEPASLTKNWRSQKEIVEFNNKVFSTENLAKALDSAGIIKELENDKQAIGEILEIFKDSAQDYKKENAYGYVRVERVDAKNQLKRDEIIQPKILKLLKELKERFKYEDIAILARDNSEVELITSWLLKAGYSVESEKTLNVIENPLIKEIISFLRFLHSPIDNLNFASFILGEIFSRTAGMPRKDITNFIFGLHMEKKLNNSASLYRLFYQKYGGIWDQYIDEFFKNVGFISPYELVTSIYQRFKIMENFSENQAFFMKFIELIKIKEDDYADLGGFLSYLKNALSEDLYVNITRSDSVKILTIHKSKGLEFPVVIIPFLCMDINPETGGKGTKSYVVPAGGRDLGLVRITNSQRVYSPILQKIYVQNYKKACIDELNNIYVALTRTQFELYIFIPRKSGSANNKAWSIIPEEINEQGTAKNYDWKKKDSQPLIEVNPSIYKDWIVSLKDEFGDSARIKNREKILKGNILHAIFSRIGNCIDQDIEKIIKEAIQFARIQFPFMRDLSFYEEKVKELLRNKTLKSIFYVPGGRIYCEKEVVNKFGELKRIDRLICKENHTTVVDYKISPENQNEHKKQVVEYMQIIKDIYPDCRVKGLLVYLDKMNIEEVRM